VLALATIVIGASGYRVGRVPGHHRLTIDLLPVLVGAHERAAPATSTPAGASATRPTTNAPELPPPRRSRLWSRQLPSSVKTSSSGSRAISRCSPPA